MKSSFLLLQNMYHTCIHIYILYIYIYSDLFRIGIMRTYIVFAFFWPPSLYWATMWHQNIELTHWHWRTGFDSPPARSRANTEIERPALFDCFGQPIGTQRWIWFIIHVYVINWRFCKLLVVENSQTNAFGCQVACCGWLDFHDWENRGSSRRASSISKTSPQHSTQSWGRGLLFCCSSVVSVFLCVKPALGTFARPEDKVSKSQIRARSSVQSFVSVSRGLSSELSLISVTPMVRSQVDVFLDKSSLFLQSWHGMCALLKHFDCMTMSIDSAKQVTCSNKNGIPSRAISCSMMLYNQHAKCFHEFHDRRWNFEQALVSMVQMEIRVKVTTILARRHLLFGDTNSFSTCLELDLEAWADLDVPFQQHPQLAEILPWSKICSKKVPACLYLSLCFSISGPETAHVFFGLPAVIRQDWNFPAFFCGMEDAIPSFLAVGRWIKRSSWSQASLPRREGMTHQLRTRGVSKHLCVRFFLPHWLIANSPPRFQMMDQKRWQGGWKTLELPCGSPGKNSFNKNLNCMQFVWIRWITMSMTLRLSHVSWWV